MRVTISVAYAAPRDPNLRVMVTASMMFDTPETMLIISVYPALPSDSRMLVLVSLKVDRKKKLTVIILKQGTASTY